FWLMVAANGADSQGRRASRMLRWGRRSLGWRAVAARRSRPYGQAGSDAPGGPRDGGLTMYRFIAVGACGVTLAACSSSWMPSIDMPSFGSGGRGYGAATLAAASDTPRAPAGGAWAEGATPFALDTIDNWPVNYLA